ncbi:Transcription factor bHLH145 [Linum grandiflorum]
MGEHCGSWIPHQQFDWQPPNFDYLGSQFQPGQHNPLSSHMNPSFPMVREGNLSAHPYNEPHHSKVGQTNDLGGWFHGVPPLRHAFVPAPESAIKEKLYYAPYDNCRSMINPNVGSGSGQKKFLVFDQCGDQTTLIFSSRVGPPAECFTSWSPKPIVASKLDKNNLGTKEPLGLKLNPLSTDDVSENDRTGIMSEMQEDTEELNALLYSDDDTDCSDDDEVTSTGHSHSTMTVHNMPDSFDGNREEIASWDGNSTRKRRLFDGEMPSVVDTASCGKASKVSRYEEDADAESKCCEGLSLASGEVDSEIGVETVRKERIRETVSILQELIPGGKGKDAVMVLDETINYLKSLRGNAKALGLVVGISKFEDKVG